MLRDGASPPYSTRQGTRHVGRLTCCDARLPDSPSCCVQFKDSETACGEGVSDVARKLEGSRQAAGNAHLGSSQLPEDQHLIQTVQHLRTEECLGQVRSGIVMSFTNSSCSVI